MYGGALLLLLITIYTVRTGSGMAISSSSSWSPGSPERMRTIQQHQTRGAECHARCYQLLDDNPHRDTSGAGEVTSRDERVWSCMEGDASVSSSCAECFQETATNKSDCDSICTLNHVCSERCQCLHRTKEENTMPAGTASSVAEAGSTPLALELVCRDVLGGAERATLVVRVLHVPARSESLAFFVEVRAGQGQWIHHLTTVQTVDNILELRYLDYNQDYAIRVSIYNYEGLILPPVESEGFITLKENHVPTAVREVRLLGYSKVQEPYGDSSILVGNITWTPAEDKVCCYEVLKSSKGKIDIFQDTVCQQEHGRVRGMLVTPGERTEWHVRAVTGLNKESSFRELEEVVPFCPDVPEEAGKPACLREHCDQPPLIRFEVKETVTVEQNSTSPLSRYDLHLSWSMASLAPHAPHIVAYRLKIVSFRRELINSTNFDVSAGEEVQFAEGRVSAVWRSALSAHWTAYQVQIQAEDECGKLGSVASDNVQQRHVRTTKRNPKKKTQTTRRTAPPATSETSLPPLAHSMVPLVEAPAPPQIQPDTANATAMASGAALAVLVLAAAIMAVTRRLCHVHRFGKRQLSASSRTPFYLPEQRDAGKKAALLQPSPPECEPLKRERQASEVPPEVVESSHLLVTRDNLRLGAVLGEGAFGVVRRGQIRKAPGAAWKTVAVKMLKDKADPDDRRQLEREVCLMKSVGQHPHLVCMLACSAPGEDPLLVVEHCALGDLQNYLRQHWTRLAGPTAQALRYAEMTAVAPVLHSEDPCRQFAENPAYGCQKVDEKQISEPQTESNTQPSELLSPAALLSIARQVALGMEYLSSNRVVHRDLAARNVLVTSDHSVKIADFGLSRDVYEQNVYRKTGEGRVPIKWMAVESLLHQTYTSASDVWSYGILLWEIVTLGGTPYPGIATSRVFPLLRSGYRMERPDNCSEQLYEVMLSCWQTHPTDRPTFTQLKESVELMLETCAATGPYLPLQDYAEEAEQTSAQSIEAAVTEPLLTDVEYLEPVPSTTPEEQEQPLP